MSTYEQDGAAAAQPEVTRLEQPSAASPAAAPPRPPPRRVARWRWPLMIGAPVLVIAIAFLVWITGGRFEGTDDSYVNASRVNVSSNVAGRVIEIAVRDNQFVHKGDLLFRLDPAPYQAIVDQDAAQLATVQQNVTGLQAGVGQRQAEVKAAQDQFSYATTELARQRKLFADGVSSKAQLDQATTNVSQARANVAAAQQAQANALAGLGGQLDRPMDQRAQVKAAQAALEQAQLNLGYATIRAPQDGIVNRVEQLQVGSYINPAQALFLLVAPRVWVDANFKENQLAHMHPGQPATVKVDAYPGTVFHGRVGSFSPGTGEAFAVLPAQNATGNWVKVTQRLPVRIELDANELQKQPLQAGLSANVKVDTGFKRHL